METLKIAMLAPEFLPNWGGAGTYSILLARELSKTDEIHVFTTNRSGQDPFKAAREIEKYFDDRLKVIVVSNATERFWYNMIFQFNVTRHLPRIIAREKYDIIHSNHAHMPDIGLKFLRPKGNSITTVHTTLTSQFLGIKNSYCDIDNMDGSERMVRFGFPFLTLLERFYLARSNNLIFVSDFIQNEVNRIIKKPAARCRLVRNGIDLEHFNCGADPDTQENRINIMYTGRLLALKGLNHLMDAFAQVRKSYPEAHLTLVGDGDINKWSEAAIQCGVPRGAITFTGRKRYEEMPSMLAKADIFVLPSMSESMPLSLLEAMACGKPSIASRVGGIPEIIKNDENGFLVKPGDRRDLAERLTALIRDPNLRERLGKAGRLHIEKEFNLKDMVKETREMFCDVANEGDA